MERDAPLVRLNVPEERVGFGFGRVDGVGAPARSGRETRRGTAAPCPQPGTSHQHGRESGFLRTINQPYAQVSGEGGKSLLPGEI